MLRLGGAFATPRDRRAVAWRRPDPTGIERGGAHGVQPRRRAVSRVRARTRPTTSARRGHLHCPRTYATAVRPRAVVMTSPSPSNNLLQGNGAPDTADATAAGADASSSASSRNPLLCFLCEDYYDDPCILICFHTFCAKCVRGKNQDGKINCPLCGWVHDVSSSPGRPLPYQRAHRYGHKKNVSHRWHHVKNTCPNVVVVFVVVIVRVHLRASSRDPFYAAEELSGGGGDTVVYLLPYATAVVLTGINIITCSWKWMYSWQQYDGSCHHPSRTERDFNF